MSCTHKKSEVQNINFVNSCKTFNEQDKCEQIPSLLHFNKQSVHNRIKQLKGKENMFQCFYACTQISSCYEIGKIKNVTQGCILYRKNTNFLMDDKDFDAFRITDEMRKSVMCFWTKEYGMKH